MPANRSEQPSSGLPIDPTTPWMIDGPGQSAGPDGDRCRPADRLIRSRFACPTVHRINHIIHWPSSLNQHDLAPGQSREIGRKHLRQSLSLRRPEGSVRKNALKRAGEMPVATRPSHPVQRTVRIPRHRNQSANATDQRVSKIRVALFSEWDSCLPISIRKTQHRVWIIAVRLDLPNFRFGSAATALSTSIRLTSGLVLDGKS